MGVLGYEPLEDQIGAGCEAPANGRARDEAPPIREIVPGGLGARGGLLPGDRILSINRQPIRDAIDLLFHAAESRLAIRFERPGEPKPLRIALSRASGEELGVVLEDFKIRMCNNQCVFCFIHQNPPGLRKGIYFKDGDFRMSFLHGNYVTTTNMKDEDFERIISQVLSPVYVSVHTTNHDLRLKMLGVRRSTDVLANLRRFTKGGIDFHTQIVLCPGWNDGAELERTIRELAPLRPHLLSIAIVPLGMTEHREGLPVMRPVTPSFCRTVIEQIEPFQKRLKAKCGEPILFLADEFYVTAGRAAPGYRDASVLHQLENGVGMVWDFMLPWRKVLRQLPERMKQPRSVAILTGLLGARILRKPVQRFAEIGGLRVEVLPCLNSLFGNSITVSGLLSGSDFRRAILENPGFDRYLIPGNAVRAEGQVFLDDVSVEQLERSAPGRVRIVDGNCASLAEAILEG